MPSRCVYYNCSTSDRSLFWWPQDPSRGRKWTAFVSRKRAQWKPSGTSVLCKRHFTDDSFSNYSMYQSGFASKLRLKPDAIPTLHVNDESCEGEQSSQLNIRPAFAKRQHKQLVESLIDESQSHSPEVEPPAITDDILDKEVQTNLQTETKGIQTLSWTPKCNRRHYKKVKKRRPSKKNTATQMTPQKKSSKRTYCDSDDDLEFIDQSPSTDYDSDSDYDPTKDPLDISSDDSDDEFRSPVFEEMSDEADTPLHTRTKFIVFQSALLMLFTVCSICKGKNTVLRKVVSTQLTVKTICQQCHNETEWQSEPCIRRTPVTGLLLSLLVVWTGNLTSKFIRLLRSAGIQCQSTRSMFRHQAKYAYKAVFSVWQSAQRSLFQSIKNTSLLIGGDARCDSPGHSAKYCIYSIMNLRTNQIISSELIQSNEVSSSNAMELEGLKRATKPFKNFKVEAFISDMHMAVHKWTRDTWQVPHHYDTWHCVKAVVKKLEKLGKRKGFEDILAWIPSIRVHLYWCAMSSKPGDHEDIKQKWSICLEHILNNHESCLHGSYDKKKKWILPECTQLYCIIMKTANDYKLQLEVVTRDMSCSILNTKMVMLFEKF